MLSKPRPQHALAVREAALKRGVEELQDLLEYLLRSRRRALKYARERYVKFALTLYRAIERAES